MAQKDIWPEPEEKDEEPWDYLLDPGTLVLLVPGYELSHEDIEVLKRQQTRLLPGWTRRDKDKLG